MGEFKMTLTSISIVLGPIVPKTINRNILDIEW